MWASVDADSFPSTSYGRYLLLWNNLPKVFHVPFIFSRISMHLEYALSLEVDVEMNVVLAENKSSQPQEIRTIDKFA